VLIAQAGCGKSTFLRCLEPARSRPTPAASRLTGSPSRAPACRVRASNGAATAVAAARGSVPRRLPVPPLTCPSENTHHPADRRKKGRPRAEAEPEPQRFARQGRPRPRAGAYPLRTYRAANSSASRLRGPWPWSPRGCSSTNHQRPGPGSVRDEVLRVMRQLAEERDDHDRCHARNGNRRDVADRVLLF